MTANLLLQRQQIFTQPRDEKAIEIIQNQVKTT